MLIITKQKLIDREIFELENFLTSDEATKFWYLCNRCTWNYGRVSNTFSGKKQSRMTFSFDNKNMIATDLWRRCVAMFDERLSLSKAYINYADSATVNLPHCDGEDDGPSILICLNSVWDREWFGYTCFFKGMSSQKIIKTVVPEPGKAIVFNGSTWHTGTPVSPYAEYPRFILTLHCFLTPTLVSDDKNKKTDVE